MTSDSLEREWVTQQSNILLRQNWARLATIPSPAVVSLGISPTATSTETPSELSQRIEKVRGQRLIEVQRFYPKYIQPALEFFDPNRFREFEEVHTNIGYTFPYSAQEAEGELTNHDVSPLAENSPFNTLQEGESDSNSTESC
eukprot:6875081-Heterocapsa_arctica.AAC.1